MSVYFFCAEIVLSVIIFGYVTWKLLQDKACLSKEKESIRDSFSDEEKKVRSNWFLAFILVYAFFFVSSIPNWYFSISEIGVIGSVASVLIYFSSTVAMYYFAYLKSGTKWLGTSLCISLVLLVLAALAIFFIPAIRDSKVNLMAVEMSFVSSMLISLPFSVYFFIHCKRLYDLNRELKKRKISQLVG